MENVYISYSAAINRFINIVAPGAKGNELPAVVNGGAETFVFNSGVTTTRDINNTIEISLHNITSLIETYTLAEGQSEERLVFSF